LSRAERQLRKISLYLFIKFFMGHLQPGWTLVNPAQQQALPVARHTKDHSNGHMSLAKKITKPRIYFKGNSNVVRQFI